jgi:hypothetical protein
MEPVATQNLRLRRRDFSPPSGSAGAELTSLGLAGRELLRGNGHVADLAADRDGKRWASITVAFSWGTPLAWIPS